MNYTAENIMNYTRTREICKEKRTYIELGPEGNKYYKYDYVKAYVDLVLKPRLEKAISSREEIHKELIAEYHNCTKPSFAFYISVSTEEEWLSTSVEIELDAYLLDMGEHYLFFNYLSKDNLGEQSSKIIREFIELIENGSKNKKTYSIQ